MNRFLISTFFLIIFAVSQAMSQNYISNRTPLAAKKYIELPLGSIKASGWLLEMLQRQRSGATGRLNELYPQVMGKRNGWLGGDGDQWERGPYWIDGLTPLAYILDDKELIAKVKPWIEWAINSQQSDGYFGPVNDYDPEPGLQRNRSRDWWPKMVMLKVLQQYYSATKDERVIKLLTNYFRYQLKTLPDKPLGHWSFWAEYREADNLNAVYWLYNITGEKFLLELGELLHEQGFNFKHFLTDDSTISQLNGIHGVNLAQGLKEPVIYYQQSKDYNDIATVKKGLGLIKRYHGFPTGMYAADESTHGTNPTQGSELCSAVEMMYSMERMLEITGDIDFADHLERIAFNVLPSQINEQFTERQYFQQINQVMVSRHIHNFDINHDETDIIYGFLTGYPCCTSNMHQGWPKFTQNLWYATNDDGVAALVYSPSKVSMRVANGVNVNIEEKTFYPFDENIQFTIRFDKNSKRVKFPFHLRIPKWCKTPRISINGKSVEAEINSGIAVINREWENGDVLSLKLPMEIVLSTWHERSVAVERGPLLYALKIEEIKKSGKFTAKESKYGSSYTTYTPGSAWNYGLLEYSLKDIDKYFKTIRSKNPVGKYPWTQKDAPLEIQTIAKKIKSWTLYNEMAGSQPYGHMIYGTKDMHEQSEQTITLIPFGCTRLRIAEFPVINNPIK